MSLNRIEIASYDVYPVASLEGQRYRWSARRSSVYAVVQPIIIENQKDITWGPFAILDSGDLSQYAALKIRLESKKPANTDDEQGRDC